MAGIIRLNAEGLQSASSQLKQQGNELENLINQMQSVINSLPDSWEGATAVAYVNQFSDLRPGLNQTRELVQTIAVQIDDALRAVQELDSSLAGQLGGN